MKTKWQVPTQNPVQASKSSFALNQNTFSALTAPEAWRFGATRTLAYVTYATRKLADPKKRSHV